MDSNAEISLFSNYPSSVTDLIYLNLKSSDLKYLVSNTTVSDSTHLAVFYSQIAKSFDGMSSGFLHRCTFCCPNFTERCYLSVLKSRKHRKSNLDC